MTNYQIDIALGTHRGRKRATNEDAVGYHYPEALDTVQRQGVLLIVADGVGGLEGGEQASDYAVKRIRHLYDEQPSSTRLKDRLRTTIELVNRDVHQRFDTSATTLVVAVIQQATCTIAHVGDSRAYLRRNQVIRQLTTDHAAQVQTSSGKMKKKLTAAIGHKATVEVEITETPIKQGDWLCLVTDGITRYIDDASLLHMLETSPFLVVRRLLSEAYHAGGKDNSSAVIAHVGPPLENQTMLDGLLQSLQKRGIEVHLPDVIPPPVDTSPSDPTTNHTAPSSDRIEPDTPAAEQNTASRRISIPLPVLLIVLMLIAGGAIWWATQQSPVTLDVATQPTATDTPANDPPAVTNTPVSVLTATGVPSVTPTATASATATLPPGILLTGMRVRFQDTATTYVRIGADTAAFPLTTDTVYEVIDIYEDASSRWYELLDTSTPRERSGWIQQIQLPDYRIIHTN